MFDVVGFLAKTATVSGTAATAAVADDATGVGVLDDVTLFVTVPIFAVSAGILGGIWLAGGFEDLATPLRPEADLLRQPALPGSPQLGGDKRRPAPPSKAPIRRIDEHGNEWTQAGDGSWEMTSHVRGAPGGLGDRAAVFPDDASGARSAAAVVQGGADLASRVMRLQDQVPGLRRREALGMARFEMASGRDVTPAVVDRGSDFVDRMFGQVDLKGPYVTEDLRPLDMDRMVRDRNGTMVPRLDEAIGAVIREANDSGSDTIVIDLLGLTQNQADQFVEAVQAGVGNKQLVFLR